MANANEFDPRDRVDVTRVSKRGDWITVEGHVRGRDGKVSIDIPAPSLEGRTRLSADALMRRSLFGESERKREA